MNWEFMILFLKFDAGGRGGEAASGRAHFAGRLVAVEAVVGDASLKKTGGYMETCDSESDCFMKIIGIIVRHLIAIEILLVNLIIITLRIINHLQSQT